MDPDKEKQPSDEEPKKDDLQTESSSSEAPSSPTPASLDDDDKAPADALSRTPEELEEEAAAKEAANPTDEEPVKKLSPIKVFFRKVNVYLLIFILLFVVAGAIAIVNYINNQNAIPEDPTIAGRDLSQEDLQELANNDASVGNTSQTLTIQGNAIIAGQTLMRGNLDVAGTIQSGSTIQGTGLTISGTSNLGETQINGLQVANGLAVEGATTMRDLNVSGGASFGGAITASQITVSRLIMSGNSILEVPNNIRFTGPTPNRSINGAVLGAGGSASINGSDSAGTININTGNNPAPGCFMQVTFTQAFPTEPNVIISPIGSGAARTQYYVDRNASGFSVCTVNAAPANQAFGFDYFITS